MTGPITTASLRRRIEALEAARLGVRVRPSYVVQVPDAAWDDPAVLDEAIMRRHAETGYRGPVIIGSIPCATAEGWMARYGSAAP